MKLSWLPLRPTTLSLLMRNGYATTQDLAIDTPSKLNNTNSFNNNYHTNTNTKINHEGGSNDNNIKSGGGGMTVSNLATELGVSLREAAGILREVRDAVKDIKGDKDDNWNGNGTNQNNVEDGQGPSKRMRMTMTAASILRQQRPNPSSPSSSSQSSSLAASRPIVTFVQSLDSLLGGGIHPGELTEVVGPPGSGKTQLATQLCVDATLPRHLGGTAGAAIYIDSEGSFSPERCFHLANALVAHVHRKQSSGHHKHSLRDWYHHQYVMDNISVYRVHDQASQEATILSLPKVLQSRRHAAETAARAIRGNDARVCSHALPLPVRLIVLDSIAFHYRCSSTDYKTRTKSLTTMATFLSDLASTYDLAVLVINHVTTKIDSHNTTFPLHPHSDATFHTINNSNNNNNNSTSRLVPALGESWAHAITTRLLLQRDTLHGRREGFHNEYSRANAHARHHSDPDGERRMCHLIKSPHRAAGVAYFTILDCGLRDLVGLGRVRS